MARIAIGEPQDDVRLLIEHVLVRMGHDPVGRHEADDADALLIEPASPHDLALARHVREQRRELPIVCISIEPASEDALALDPAVYLVKPFTLAGLRDAIERALIPAERDLQPC